MARQPHRTSQCPSAATNVAAMAMTGQQYLLVAGEFSATVVEVGAGLRQLTFRGTDLVVPYGVDQLPAKGQGAVLVPWPNRLRNGHYTFHGTSYQLPLSEPATGNAIHGLGRWIRWTPLAVAPSSVTLAIDVVPQPGYVFQLHVAITYELDADRGLLVTIRAVNTGDQPAPFGAGFHPYLSTHGHALDDVTVRVPARLKVVTDAAKVPIGTRTVSRSTDDLRRGRRLRSTRFDDCFTGLGGSSGPTSVEVSTKSGGTRVWCDPAFGWLQLFTVAELWPSVAGVAVEPMTCPADAFNSGEGLIVLEPGQPWSAQWGITPL
jgi:aldose 1-epimerase